ncbi:hypothetical protein WNY78_14005 [Psychroserpens sp. AS72]|uniref:hypothetical protein n=1 Tax=Psychroserpens sp. AS72 TaxID=3135775 RepID=UPI00316F3641
MNIKPLIFIILFLSLQCYSQHSERLINLTSNLKPSDTIHIDLKYSNGNQKEIGTVYEYEFGDYIYSYYSGKRIEYYRDGSIAVEHKYDDFGILLSCKYYYGDGNLWFETQTLKIDSNAIDLKSFFEKEKHLTITVKDSDFRYDNVKCDYYLKKEGQRINGKKVGIWKTYNTDGSIKKVSSY